jgi:hypothetical protein
MDRIQMNKDNVQWKDFVNILTNFQVSYYWLLSQGGIVQSVPCTVTIF